MKLNLLFIILCITSSSLLAKKDIDSKYKPLTTLYQAAIDGNFELAKKLIADGININERNKTSDPEHYNLTPVYGAIFSKNKEILDLLIKHKVNLNIYGNYSHYPYILVAVAKLKSIEENDHKLIVKLLENGAYKGFDQALFWLVYFHQPGSFSLLIDLLNHRKELEKKKVLPEDKNLLSKLLFVLKRSIEKNINLNSSNVEKEKIMRFLINYKADENWHNNENKDNIVDQYLYVKPETESKK